MCIRLWMLQTEQNGGSAEEGLDDRCVGRLCPNDEGSMSQDDATLNAGLQAKPPQGWAIGGILSVVHGAVGSPSGHCLLTAHHLDSLWASWGFSALRKSGQVCIRLASLQGFSAESSVLIQVLHRDGCCQQKLRNYSLVSKA